MTTQYQDGDSEVHSDGFTITVRNWGNTADSNFERGFVILFENKIEEAITGYELGDYSDTELLEEGNTYLDTNYR